MILIPEVIELRIVSSHIRQSCIFTVYLILLVLPCTRSYWVPLPLHAGLRDLKKKKKKKKKKNLLIVSEVINS